MKNFVPNLRHLRALKEIEKHRNISTVATIVHLSQPALTQAVAKIESILDVDLFERKTNGLFVTEPGQLLIRRVDKFFVHLRAGAVEAVHLGRVGKIKRNSIQFLMQISAASFDNP